MQEDTHIKKSLDIIEGSKSGIAITSESIGILENTFNILSKKESELSESEINDDDYISIIIHIGSFFQENGENKKAILYYEKGYVFSQKKNDMRKMKLFLVFQAGIFGPAEDFGNLTRICDLHDMLGGEDDILMDGWKRIVELHKTLNMGTSKSGCFIATAAYGTPFDPKIDVLRTWRDDSLQKSIFGRSFIKFYYSISPPIAKVISMSIFLRWLVRISISPIIMLLKRKYN